MITSNQIPLQLPEGIVFIEFENSGADDVTISNTDEDDGKVLSSSNIWRLPLPDTNTQYMRELDVEFSTTSNPELKLYIFVSQQL